MEIRGNVFLVSGGGSGLGAACVRMLAARGARVIIADVNDEAGRDLADEVDGAQFVHTDVTEEDRVREAVARAAAEASSTAGGSFRGVINCAGVAIAKKVLGREEVHDVGSFKRVLEVNLIGTFNVLRLAADALRETEPTESGERGVIINTASVAAYEGQIGQVAYSASKGGVVGLTLPAARELARYGIRVVTIAPGIFDTPMLAGLPEKARESLGQQVPFPSRLGKPEEYAALAKHVIENPMLNGEVVRLDGALRMGAR